MFDVGNFGRLVLPLIALAGALASTAGSSAADPPARPNVVLIMTDDQGYGDLGFHGNPIVRTPNLDEMATKSARLSYFYVSPVCTPTRACLMTGRYNYRTRAIDTFLGRAMMDAAEVTIAELLRDAGYATGIFGKWHLGDCYPMRPMDQGFAASLVHRGGGIGQPSDPPGAEDKYTDAVLFRNGEPEQTRGYCTDVYFTEAMKWAGEASRGGKPFFLYLPTNCPHGPFGDVPPEEYAYYKEQAIAADRFPDTPGNPIPRNMNADTQARVYAMIENIDQNVGRLLKWLEEQQLSEKTLVIFMTDNGRATPGYNAGLRGNKGTVYEGGLRSPFFAYWPGVLKAGVASDRIAAHIDIAPTLLEVCGAEKPAELKLDGTSIWPLLSGKVAGTLRVPSPSGGCGSVADEAQQPGFAADDRRTSDPPRNHGPSATQAANPSHPTRSVPATWPDRTLFTQSHRGDEPVLYHNCAIRTDRWKLVSATGFGPEQLPAGGPRWELFDMQADPYEQHNVAAQNPDVVTKLKGEYEAWFKDVSSTRPDNYAPPRIIVGSPHERTTVLTRQDWRGAGWGPRDEGHWEIEVASAGAYDVNVIVPGGEGPRSVRLRIGDQSAGGELAAGATQIAFPMQKLPQGQQKVEAWVEAGGQRSGVRFVEISQAN